MVNTLNDSVKSHLLSLKSSQQLPLSDRSFDHMVHFLKSSSPAEAESYFEVLGSKMSQNDFDRLNTRIAKHFQINPSDSGRAVLFKAMNNVRNKKLHPLSFAQNREVSRLDVLSKSELESHVKSLVDSKDFTNGEKAQIFSKLLVRNPRQFKRVMGHLNKLSKDPSLPTSNTFSSLTRNGLNFIFL